MNVFDGGRTKHQRGAALVIVMAFLSGGLIVGVSGINSSLIDARLAGNYNAVSTAYTRSEFFLAEIIDDVDSYFDADNLKDCDLIVQDYAESRNQLAPLDLNAQSGGFVACDESDSNNRVFLIEGYVGNQDNPEAFHVLKLTVETVLGEDLLPDYAVLAGGAVSQSGNSTIEGEFEQNVGTTNVPDPRDESPSDPSRTGYISNIRDRAASNDSAVLQSCDISSIGDLRNDQTQFVYCDSSFSGSNFGDEIDGLVIVAESDIGSLNIQDDVEASFVSGGSISFQGFGNNTLTGIVWAAGSVSFGGRSNVIGGIYSGGAISFSGRSIVTSDSGVSLDDGSGGNNYRWEDAIN